MSYSVTRALTPSEQNDLMTLREYKHDVHAGILTDDEGIGYLATDMEVSTIEVPPSFVDSMEIDAKYTHVLWLDKEPE